MKEGGRTTGLMPGGEPTLRRDEGNTQLQCDGKTHSLETQTQTHRRQMCPVEKINYKVKLEIHKYF